ncbi:MAG TPA: Flp pilus assembly protein CpaB [Streptosporangiaceae bacterium]|nr:Flp pilus assembly protein CpaB [Streptosporangiaceae bacterium]
MKRRMLTVMLAGFLAVLGIVAVLVYVRNIQNKVVQGYQRESVLVANGQIPAGTNARQAQHSGLLIPKQLPKFSVPDDAIHTISADISTLVTSTPIQPGHLLLRENLVSRSQRTGNLVIPPGRVAVTMEVCQAADVGGYIRPQNYVAVYGAWPTGSTQLEASCSGGHQVPTPSSVFGKLVLPRVYVLSVTTAPPAGSTSAPGTTLASNAAAAQGALYVTLAATPQQAKLLILLNATGLPSFALTTPSSGITADSRTVHF